MKKYIITIEHHFHYYTSLYAKKQWYKADFMLLSSYRGYCTRYFSSYAKYIMFSDYRSGGELIFCLYAELYNYIYQLEKQHFEIIFKRNIAKIIINAFEVGIIAIT